MQTGTNVKWFDTPEGKESLARANSETREQIDKVSAALATVFAVAAAEQAGLKVAPDTDPVDDFSAAVTK